MDDMIEIARLISTIGLKQSDFYLSDSESSVMTSFYSGLVSGEFKNDDIAAKKLYASSPKDERYRKLKLRLREKLFEASVFINYQPPKFSVLRQKMYECNREVCAMKQCIENGAQTAGYTIAKRLVAKARKYHLTIVEIECLYTILNHISFSTGNEKDYFKISDELLLAQRKMNAETESEIIYGSVSVKYATINSDHPENFGFVEDGIRKLELLLTQFDTFKIRYNYFMLRSWLGQVQRDYDARLKACDDAISYWESNPSIAGNLTAIFTLEKIACTFHQRNYESFFTLVPHCENLLDKNTSSWLILKSYEVQVHLSISQLVHAVEVFKNVQKILKRSGGGLTKFSDQWLILEGYIYFFIHSENAVQLPEYLKIPPVEKYLRKLVSSEFDSILTDKEGANVGLMILHVLLLLCMKCSPVDIYDKVVALDRYRRRYLDPRMNNRTGTFITLLKNFTSALLNKNNMAKIQGADTIILSLTDQATEDYELIPFDILWKRLLSIYE